MSLPAGRDMLIIPIFSRRCGVDLITVRGRGKLQEQA